MNIEILQEHLVTAVNQLQKVLPTKPQLPILSSILLTAEENSIGLAATDLYLGMQTGVLGKVNEPGKIAIPGKVFRDYISSLSPGKLTLSLTNQTLTISSETNTTTIQCVAPDEFPEFPEIEGEHYELPLTSLQDIDTSVRFTTSIDPTRPVLTAYLLRTVNEGLQVVGTDGFRLATLLISQQLPQSLSQLLLPAKAMSEVTRISTQQGIESVGFTVSEKLKQVLFSIGNTKLSMRLIEGEYPPFEKIIPPEFSTKLTIDGKELEEQLKRALVFSRDASNIVKFSFQDKEMNIIATSPVYGTYQGKILVDGDVTEKKDIAFNARYILEFLSALKPERVQFSMNESLTPARLNPVGMEQLTYIVMPFRVNE